MASNAHQKLLVDLTDNREIYLHQINLVNEQALLVRLPVETQGSAPFLDARVLTPGIEGAWFPWAQLAERAGKMARPKARYIFHMGHCGSTLVSRLVAAASGGAALREPLPFRTIAMDMSEGAGAFLSPDEPGARLGVLEKLWMRGPAPMVVKATSICTGLADRVDRDAAKVFLYQKPETQLAVTLAGEQSAVDLRGFAQMRYRRLARHFDLPPLAGCGRGVLAALVWLTEMRAATVAALPMLNFDSVLSDPHASVGRLCEMLDLEAGTKAIDAAVEGPIMQTYSKAPEHKYDAALRNDVIASARHNHGAEILEGMKWLESVANKNAAAADLLKQFA